MSSLELDNETAHSAPTKVSDQWRKSPDSNCKKSSKLSSSLENNELSSSENNLRFKNSVIQEASQIIEHKTRDLENVYESSYENDSHPVYSYVTKG